MSNKFYEEKFSAENLPWADNSFDFVPKSKLKKIIINLFGKIGDYLFEEGHVSVYTKNEFLEYFAKGGFKNPKIISVNKLSSIQIIKAEK